MIVDTDAVAIVEFEKLFPFVTSNGDGLSAKLPYSILEWVVKPGEIDHAMFSDMNNVNVLERLHMLLDEIIDEFDK